MKKIIICKINVGLPHNIGCLRKFSTGLLNGTISHNALFTMFSYKNFHENPMLLFFACRKFPFADRLSNL